MSFVSRQCLSYFLTLGRGTKSPLEIFDTATMSGSLFRTGRQVTSAAFLALAVVTQLSSNVVSDVSYNYWIRGFPSSETASNVTIIVLSSAFYFVLLVPAAVIGFVIWSAWQRRQLRRYRRIEEAGGNAASRDVGDEPLLRPREAKETKVDDDDNARSPPPPEDAAAEKERVEANVDVADFMWHQLRRMRSFWVWGLVLALSDFSIDVFGTYSASYTSVLLQVTTKALEPPLTLAVTLACFSGERRLLKRRPLVPVLASSIACVVLGVVLHVLPNWLPQALMKTHPSADAAEFKVWSSADGAYWFWPLLWLARVAASATYNVSQGAFVATGVAGWIRYRNERRRERRQSFEARAVDRLGEMRHETVNTSALATIGADGGGGSSGIQDGCVVSDNDGHGDEDGEQSEETMPADRAALNWLRLAALCFDFTVGLVLSVALVPAVDAIPWFGSSASVSSAWRGCLAGAVCILSPSHAAGALSWAEGGSHPSNASSWASKVEEKCETNLLYAVVTNAAWTLVYAGDVVINFWSPAANSIVNLLGAPVAATVLIIHPAWSLSKSSSLLTTFGHTMTLLCSVLSVGCLTMGAFCFFAWEMWRTDSSSRGVVAEEGRGMPSDLSS